MGLPLLAAGVVALPCLGDRFGGRWVALSVWLYRGGKRPWFTVVSMALVMAVTVTSLAFLVDDLAVASVGSSGWINDLVAVVGLGLTALLVVAAVRVLRPGRPAAAAGVTT